MRLFYRIRNLTVGLFFLLAGSCFAEEEDVTSSTQIDYDYDARFRPGHNATILFSLRQSIWSFSMDETTVSSSGLSSEVFARYAFHVNIFGKLGFFMGSTAGVGNDVTHSRQIAPGYAIYFPSMTVGFVHDYSRKSRALVGAEYAAIWYPNMRVRINNQQYKVSEIPTTFAFFIGMESVFGKNISLGVQAGYRFTDNKNIDAFGNNGLKQDMFYYMSNRGMFFQFSANWEIVEGLGLQ